jgi:hypothetical protein
MNEIDARHMAEMDEADRQATAGYKLSALIDARLAEVRAANPNLSVES